MTLKRTLKALSLLLPASALGASAALAASAASGMVPKPDEAPARPATANVAQRLQVIRTGVSEVMSSPDIHSSSIEKPFIFKAWWHNGGGWGNGGWGWRNGGWGNGGWHNGGWGNGGWHNGGWGNGGWGNGGWGNGWHNGWANW